MVGAYHRINLFVLAFYDGVGIGEIADVLLTCTP
jgi:hypothetical protein